MFRNPATWPIAERHGAGRVVRERFHLEPTRPCLAVHASDSPAYRCISSSAATIVRHASSPRTTTRSTAPSRRALAAIRMTDCRATKKIRVFHVCRTLLDADPCVSIHGTCKAQRPRRVHDQGATRSAMTAPGSTRLASTRRGASCDCNGIARSGRGRGRFVHTASRQAAATLHLRPRCDNRVGSSQLPHR